MNLAACGLRQVQITTDRAGKPRLRHAEVTFPILRRSQNRD
jgi:hypothetical protein